MTAALTYLAAKPAWAIRLAIWALLTGATGWALRRAAEILAGEDIPMTRQLREGQL